MVKKDPNEILLDNDEVSEDESEGDLELDNEDLGSIED